MSTEGFWNVHAFTGNANVPLRPALVEHPDSTQFMLRDLANSGLLPTDLDAYPIAPDRGTPQYVIPYPQDGMYRTKREDPKFKYRAPQGRNEVWYSSHQAYNTFRASPLLLIVEGEKKAARAVKEWPSTPVLAIGGVWNGTLKQPDGTYRLHETILNAVAPGQKIKIIFDNDIQERDDLQKAAYTLYTLLERQFCQVELLVPPKGTKGLDDYLVARALSSKEPRPVEEVGLVQVPFDSLAPTRAALIEELDLLTNEEGGIRTTSTNYEKLFYKFVGADIRYDERLGIVAKTDEVEMENLEIGFIRYIERLGLPHRPIHIDFAIRAFIKSVTTDVLLDEIRAVEWDGVPRLDTWGNDYIPNSLNWVAMSNEWGRLLITGMAMRLIEPGTKFDHVMFLVGPQGTYKTSFFEKLAKFKCGDFYSTIEKIGIDDSAKRTFGTAARRNIVLDFSESTVLDGRQTSLEALKSFITHTHDDFREVYAKESIKLPRSFILVGTSNKRNQLFDTTGSRRFAMLDVKDYVRPLEYDTKMQLLAEVLANLPQIKQSEWWELRLSWDNMPSEIVEEIVEHGYVPNANLSEGSQVLEGINRKHLREDPNIAEFKLLLESAEDIFPSLSHDSEQFMTTNQHLMGLLNMTRHEVNTMLRRLIDDPHFPWKIAAGPIANLFNFVFPPGINKGQLTSGSSNKVNPLMLTRK